MNEYFTSLDVHFLIQVSEAKQAHPNAKWWLKADGCDLVEALGESVHHIWSGDEDLSDGEVARQHSQYMHQLERISSHIETSLLQQKDQKQWMS